MALLVFLNRSVEGDALDKPERGDVIAVLPDGQSPGTQVTVDAGFHQIRVPGDPAQWNHLVAPVVERVDRGDGELVDHVTKFRARQLAVPSDLERRLKRGVVDVDKRELEALIEVKSG